jgi:hypothetical protein
MTTEVPKFIIMFATVHHTTEHTLSLSLSLSLWLYNPLDLGRFSSFLIYRVGGTPWTGDQPVARPLPTHRTTQTQNKRTDIHASGGIRTHDPSVRAGEDSTCLRPRDHCYRYQATTGEDNRGLRRLRTCCSEPQSVWISDSAIVMCSYEL